MNDLELRDVLAILTHQLNAHVLYLQRLHRSYVALYEAQKAADPEFEGRHRQTAGPSQGWPAHEEWLRALDELIERLQPK